MKVIPSVRFILCCLLIVFLCCFSFFGCTARENDLAQCSSRQIDGELLIYTTPDTDAFVRRGVLLLQTVQPSIQVHVETIADRDDYLVRIETETAAGAGPDVILLSLEDVDLEKVIRSGAFQPLDDLISNDEEFNMEDFYPGIMEAGLVEDVRYAIPLGFRVNALMTTKEQMISQRFSLPETFSGFCDQSIEFSNLYFEDVTQYFLSNEYGALCFMIMGSGIHLVDYQNEGVLPDPEAFRELLETYKGMYRTLLYREQEGVTYPNSINTGIYQGNIRYWEVASGQFLDVAAWISDISTPVVCGMPSVDGDYAATIQLAASINISSSNQGAAWEFIKILLSKNMQLYGMGEAICIYQPVRRGMTSEYALSYGSTIGAIITENDGSRYTYHGIPAEVIESYEEILTQASYVPFSWRVYEFVETDMKPFFENTATYEACFLNLKNDLMLYIGE